MESEVPVCKSKRLFRITLARVTSGYQRKEEKSRTYNSKVELTKGTNFDHLTQDDIVLMMSHINSYTRKKLGNQSAYQLFSSFYGEKILKKLGIKHIPSSDINLTPKLSQK